jgi:hypothetical protein
MVLALSDKTCSGTAKVHHRFLQTTQQGFGILIRVKRTQLAALAERRNKGDQSLSSTSNMREIGLHLPTLWRFKPAPTGSISTCSYGLINCFNCVMPSS